jgi:hypothetical protein
VITCIKPFYNFLLHRFCFASPASKAAFSGGHRILSFQLSCFIDPSFERGVLVAALKLQQKEQRHFPIPLSQTFS